MIFSSCQYKKQSTGKFRVSYVCSLDHCKLLQLTLVFIWALGKLQGKVVTHSEKLEWWIITMVDCVTILLYTSVKWLHNRQLK